MATDETPQELAARLNSLRDKVELQKEFNKLTAEAKQALIEEGSLKKEHLKTLLLIQEAEKQNLDYAERRVEATEKEIEKLKEAKGLDKSRYAQTVLQQELNKANATLRQQEIDLIEKQIKAGNIENIGRLKNLKKLDKQLKGLSKYSGKMGLMSGDSKQFTSSLKEIGGSMEQNLLAPMQKAVTGATSLKAALQASVALLLVTELINFYKRAVKLAYELGNIENAFMKATGASEEFSRSISETYREGRRFGATMEDMNKSGIALHNTFTDFTFQDRDTRKSLTTTGAVLEKLGISNDKFAQSVQLSTKALGMSADQAGQSMLDLEKYAEELGVSPERLSSQFLEAGDSLAKLGENGDEAFRDLAAAAKITGLSVTKLLNIVNQFDTFEGAARQAGKLNAALGGNFVNAMDLMMETDPTARFEQIRDSILDTGLSFDTMSYYQKNFYKDAMGLSSVSDLALVLSGNMDMVGESTKKTQQEYEDAAKRAQTVASFQEQLNILFAEMIPIITPLIDGMRSFFGWMSKNAKIIKVVTGVLLTLAGAIMIFVPGAGTVGGVAGATLGLSMLFDSISFGEKKMSGLSVLFKKLGAALKPLWTDLTLLWEPFSLLFGGSGGETGMMGIAIVLIEALTVAVNYAVIAFRLMTAPIVLTFAAISDFIKLIQGDFTWEKSSVGKWFEAFIPSIRGVLSPIMELLHAFGLIEDGFEMMGYVMFEKSYASSFLEGIVKFGEAFNYFGQGIGATLTPLSALIDKMVVLGDGPVFEVAKTVSGWFGSDDTTKATTGAPAAAATAAASAGTTVINQGPETITSIVQVDREVLARAVQKINGKSASNGLAGR